MFAPIMYNFSRKKALVVGAGKVGLRRAEMLSEYGCNVTILSEDFPDDANLDLYKTIEKRFNYEDIIGFDIVVAATDNTPLNYSIVNYGNENGLLTNCVNFYEKEGFQIPASLQVDDLFISVSTSGAFPYLSKKIRDELKEQFNQSLGSYLRLLKESRVLLKEYRNFTREQRVKAFKRLQSFNVQDIRKFNDTVISQNKKVVRIGTRGSKLALEQTQEIINKLKEKNPDLIFLPRVIKTAGDQHTKRTIKDLGGKASFIKGFNNALESGEIDFAVHSAKDIDLNQLENTEILDVFPEREASNDVLITRVPINNLEDITNMEIGTGSIRRQTFLKKANKDVKVKNIRGNVDTRIQRVRDGDYDGVVLAKAGLNRLNYNEEKLAESNLYMYELDFTPAPLQGVLAFQAKKGNDSVKELLESTIDEKTTKEASLELKIQEEFAIDCSVPFGAIVQEKDDKILVKITTFPNGNQVDVEESYSSPVEFVESLDEIIKKLGDDLE